MKKIGVYLAILPCLCMLPCLLLAEEGPQQTATEAVSGQKQAIPMPLELEGTEWQITITPTSASAGKIPVEDTLIFTDGTFNTPGYEKKGFGNAIITLSLKGEMTTWRAMQRKDGEILHWRGDFKDKYMKGIISLQLSGQDVKNYSFTGKLIKGELRMKEPEIVPQGSREEIKPAAKEAAVKEKAKTETQKPQQQKKKWWPWS